MLRSRIKPIVPWSKSTIIKIGVLAPAYLEACKSFFVAVIARHHIAGGECHELHTIITARVVDKPESTQYDNSHVYCKHSALHLKLAYSLENSQTAYYTYSHSVCKNPCSAF